MRRILLHLLLAVSLIFNGFSAPWAMAHTEQGSHADHDMHAASASDATDLMSHQHAHGDDQADNDTSDRDCCDGSNCHCGCLLPPVVATVIGFSLPRGVPADVDDSTRPLALIARSHPPFRPPAA